MKKLMFAFFAVCAMAFTTDAMSQNEVTLHLFSKGWQSQIYLDGTLLTGLNKDEALEYVVKDGKRHTVKVEFNDGQANVSFNAGGDETDFYYVAYRMVYPVVASKVKEIEAKEWKKEEKNFKDVVKMEQE